MSQREPLTLTAMSHEDTDRDDSTDYVRFVYSLARGREDMWYPVYGTTGRVMFSNLTELKYEQYLRAMREHFAKATWEDLLFEPTAPRTYRRVFAQSRGPAVASLIVITHDGSDPMDVPRLDDVIHRMESNGWMSWTDADWHGDR